MTRKKLPTTEDELRARQEVFFENIDKESDRGCVLVAVSIIDECLEILLRSQLLQSEPKVLNSLFSGQGPLNSFWSKIQFARAMDLIPSCMYEDLERIRALRNIFAHRYDSADFTDAEVVSFTEKLKGANYAVEAIKKNEKVSNLHPIDGNRDALGEPPRRISSQEFKKERLRFTFATSYIGGWLEAEVKIRELKKQITELKGQLQGVEPPYLPSNSP